MTCRESCSIYLSGSGIISYCNDCRKLYRWGTHIRRGQFDVWLADHKSYFGPGGWIEKASDIPDEAFTAAIKEVCRRRNLMPPIPHHGWTTASRWDVTTVLAGHPELVGTDRACDNWPNLPWKIVQAKAKRLVKRKVIDGCTCGCRGDYEVLP